MSRVNKENNIQKISWKFCVEDEYILSLPDKDEYLEYLGYSNIPGYILHLITYSYLCSIYLKT
jgi:hypothetical protein